MDFFKYQAKIYVIGDHRMMLNILEDHLHKGPQNHLDIIVDISAWISENMKHII